MGLSCLLQFKGGHNARCVRRDKMAAAVVDPLPVVQLEFHVGLVLVHISQKSKRANYNVEVAN